MPLILWLLLALSTNLFAQAAPPPRFAAPASSTAPAARPDTTRRGERAPIPAGFVLEQTGAAGGGLALGMLAGGLAGGLIATATTDRSAGGWEGLIGMLMGAGIVGPVGAAIAVDRFSRPRGITSSVWAAMAGGYAGWFGGPAFYLTVPLGTVTAYNLARR